MASTLLVRGFETITSWGSRSINLSMNGFVPRVADILPFSTEAYNLSLNGLLLGLGSVPDVVFGFSSSLWALLSLGFTV